MVENRECVERNYIYMCVYICIKIDFISRIMNKTFFLNLHHVFFINLSYTCTFHFEIFAFLIDRR